MFQLVVIRFVLEDDTLPVVNHPKVMAGCTLSKGLAVLNNHESLRELLSMTSLDNFDVNQEFAVIVAKIDAGNVQMDES